MVIFRLIEGGRFDDLCHDGFIEPPRFSERFLRFLGQSLLFIVMVEDCRAIFRTPIDKLPARVSGVYLSPENVQELRIGYDRRIGT